MTKICVPIDTIVNDIPIKKHRTMQQMIAGLTMENNNLKVEIAALKAKPHEFKVGDRVRIVRSTKWRGSYFGTTNVGKIGTLIRSEEPRCDFIVDTNGEYSGYAYVMSTDLEPIPPVEEPEVPEVPDWIAPGKWVEYFEGYNYRVSHTKDQYIHTNRSVIKGKVYNANDYFHISNCQPFTPPECPELPENFTFGIDKRNATFKGTMTMPIKSWIAAMGAVDHPQYWRFCEGADKLLAIQAHHEKWGEG